MDATQGRVGRRVAALAGGGLLTALLLVHLLHHVLPGNFTFAALTNFRLQFGVLALLASVLLLVARPQKLMVLTLLPALWWLGGVGLYYLPAGTPALAAPAAQPLKLLYANVNTANRDHAALLRLIAAEQPDIIGLLETDEVWRDALLPLHDTWPQQVAEYRSDNFGLVLLSRLPLAESDILHAPETGLGTVRAVVALDDRSLTCYLTHPLPPSHDRQLQWRDDQLRWLATQAASTPGEIIVMGDFNATDGTGILQEFAALSGLRDTRHGFGWQPTWPDYQAEAKALPLAPLWPWLLRIPLDHVFVSPTLTVRDRRVGSPIGSDHRPVLVTLL